MEIIIYRVFLKDLFDSQHIDFQVMTINPAKQILSLVAVMGLMNLFGTEISFGVGSLDEALELDTQAGIESLPLGAPNWICQSGATHNGVDDFAVTPPISHDQSSRFEVPITGADTISFWWKVSSERDYDTLTFRIDDDVVEQISGEVPWTNVIVEVPAGASVLSWEYSKDDSFSEGLDRAWVDELRFASKSPPLIEYPQFVGAFAGHALRIGPRIYSPADSFAFASPPPPWLSVDHDTGMLIGTPPNTGETVVDLQASNSIGSSSIERLVIRTVPLGYGLDTTVSGWRWSGEQPWFTQSEETHDGIDAMRSGPIGDGGSSHLELPVDGPALVSFWWRVDSEGSHDKLAFLIDGVVAEDTAGERAEIDDLVEWQRRSVAVPAGEHLISWTYQKDGAKFEGDDAAWLDGVEVIDSRDPDGDGISSLIERLLGLDWSTPNRTPLPMPTESAGRLSWGLEMGPALPGFELGVEISYDLKVWSEFALESVGNDPGRLEVTEKVASSKTAKFVRLRAKSSAH